MGGIQFSKAHGRCRNKLNNIGDRREGVHRADNELIKLCVVCHKSDPFAVTFGDEEAGRAPISGLVTGHYNT